MKLLAIDTAGPVVGLALSDGARLLVRQERVARGTEQLLMPWAVSLAAELGLPLASLDGVVLATGPGAFTGLRVGMAAGFGVALAAGCQVAAVGSLASRAAAVGPAAPAVLSLLDARKGRFYAAAWANGVQVEVPADLPIGEALAWMAGRSFVATGEGAEVARAEVEAAGGVVFAEAADPALRSLLALGQAVFEAGLGQDPTAIRPHYVREPDAVPRPRA